MSERVGWMNCEEAARLYEVSKVTVRNWVKSGKIRSRRKPLGTGKLKIEVFYQAGLKRDLRGRFKVT